MNTFCFLNQSDPLTDFGRLDVPDYVPLRKKSWYVYDKA